MSCGNKNCAGCDPMKSKIAGLTRAQVDHLVKTGVVSAFDVTNGPDETLMVELNSVDEYIKIMAALNTPAEMKFDPAKEGAEQTVFMGARGAPAEVDEEALAGMLASQVKDARVAASESGFDPAIFDRLSESLKTGVPASVMVAYERAIKQALATGLGGVKITLRPEEESVEDMVLVEPIATGGMFKLDEGGDTHGAQPLEAEAKAAASIGRITGFLEKLFGPIKARQDRDERVMFGSPDMADALAMAFGAGSIPLFDAPNEEQFDHFEKVDDRDVPGYERLVDVLDLAYEQAACGKGAERHANDLPFHEQPMTTINREAKSLDGFLFQARKKSLEATGLPKDRAIAEILGAINYLAGAVIALQDEEDGYYNKKLK